MNEAGRTVGTWALALAADVTHAVSSDDRELLCAVSKRGLVGANGLGMADVMAWLKKESGAQDF